MRVGMLGVVAGLMIGTVANADASVQDDLHVAYREDVNEVTRYLAFADQAEREGHAHAARLFRATAEAERVRARGHGRALRRLGMEPGAAAPGEVVVKDTRWNLLRTLAHEGAELRRGDPSGDAQARAAHAELVTLYREAIRDLREGRPGHGDLHVCGTCGHVTRGPAPDRCPVSRSPAAAFARVD